MTLNAAVAFFRREERALLASTCTVTRPDGPPTFDPDTGTYANPTSAVYEGACLTRSNKWEGTDTAAGETEVRFRGARIKFPANTPVHKDDVVTITTSPDERMVGMVFRVTDVQVDDWQISCVTHCETIT